MSRRLTIGAAVLLGLAVLGWVLRPGESRNASPSAADARAELPAVRQLKVAVGKAGKREEPAFNVREKLHELPGDGPLRGPATGLSAQPVQEAKAQLPVCRGASVFDCC